MTRQTYVTVNDVRNDVRESVPIQPVHQGERVTVWTMTTGNISYLNLPYVIHTIHHTHMLRGK